MRNATARETINREVSVRLAEAGRLRGEADYEGAVAAASMARTYLADREAPQGLVDQVDATLAELMAAVEGARRADAEAERLASFMLFLDRVQFSATARSNVREDQHRRGNR